MRVFCKQVHISGVENLHNIKGPLIIASNHRGPYDGIWIWYYLALMNRKKVISMYFVTGARFFKQPIVGWYLRQMKCFPVDRGMGIQVLDPMVAALKNGEMVGIFPEGKMQKTIHERGDAKRGVGYLIAQSEASVLPIYINYHKKLRYLPFSDMTFRVGKITSYNDYQNDNETYLQVLADDVLESVYKLNNV
jgi:1-acyl-sn-glycerol-3-phosphate acyltransferase